MKVNVNGIRFIADTIELHEEMYDQDTFGETQTNYEVAGTGVSCGTSCCVAGFVVQFLGEPLGLRKYQRECPVDKIDKQTWNYARELLSLPMEWADAIFNLMAWPKHWVDPHYKYEITVDYQGNEGEVYPSAEDAVIFLRRLADQFESEQNKTQQIEQEHVVELEYA